MREFTALRENLLSAGIAPRHVRRYVRELSDHFDDLVADECAAGIAPAEATRRAGIRLGTDDELLEAMTARREFRSLAARVPWLVFALAPPVLVLVLLVAAALVLIGGIMLYAAVYGGSLPLPAEWRFLADAACTAANFAAGPAAALALAVVAVRQRMAARWAAIGLAAAALGAAFSTLEVGLPSTGIKGGFVGVGMSSDVAFATVASRFFLTLACAGLVLALQKRRHVPAGN